MTTQDPEESGYKTPKIKPVARISKNSCSRSDLAIAARGLLGDGTARADGDVQGIGRSNAQSDLADTAQ